MVHHGDYNSSTEKWYCSYWMTLHEWEDIHDYAPPDILREELDEREMYGNNINEDQQK
jgi:hypothetical protein